MEKESKFEKIFGFIFRFATFFAVCYVCFILGKAYSTWFPEKLVGGNEVVSIICKENSFGCSLLVEKQDGSRSWVWVPTVKM